MPSKLLFFVLFLLSFSEITAQQERISIGLIDFFLPSRAEISRANRTQNIVLNLLDLNSYQETSSEVRQYQDFVVENFAADKRFLLVERSNLHLVEKELELQKSEEFMDGLTVEQGQAVGAQFLLFGDYDPYTKVLTVSLYATENQQVKAKKNIPLKGSVISGMAAIKRRITLGVQQLIFQEFSPKIKLIRALAGSGNRAKKVLVAGGSKYNLKKQQYLIVHRLTTEEVDGEALERLEKIGEVMITEVENANFSKCTVKAGGTEIQRALNAGDKIYCTVWLAR